MWLLIAGGIVFSVVLARRVFRSDGATHMGAVSSQWLASHRAGRRSIDP
jgi:hypothetical protein